MPLPVLPSVTGGGYSIITAPAQYPLTRTNNQSVIIKRSINGTEQRWQSRSGLDSFVLTYTNISQTDKNAVTAFIASVGGSAGQWTFNGDQTRSYCQFQDQAFTFQENKDYISRYNGSIRFRQTNRGNIAGATLTPGPFPGVGPNGLYHVGFSYGRTQNFQNAQVNMPGGNQFIYEYFGAGLAGFPNRDLFSWSFSLTNLNDTDTATIEAHFISAGGRYAEFQFTDPEDLKVYTVRYDIDALQIKHTGPRASTIGIQFAEVFLGQPLP